MIRPYRNIPRFDDGFDWDYADQIINNMPRQSAYPDMNMSFTGTGDDPYVRVEPQIDEMEDPAFMRMTYRDLIKKPRSSRPSTRTTTAVQDKKQAVKTYNAAIKAADKKAKIENQQANKTIQQANATLRANGQPTYDRAAAIKRLNDARARSEYYKRYDEKRRNEVRQNNSKAKSSMTSESYNNLVKKGYILSEPTKRPFIPNKTYGQSYPKVPKGGMTIKKTKSPGKKLTGRLGKAQDRQDRWNSMPWYEKLFGIR